MAQLTVQEAFDLALQHHRSGRLPQAEQIYRQLLAQQPAHAVAMHHLGVIAHQTGRNDVAIDLLRRAVALNPNWHEAHSNLGNILREDGQLDEAIAACRRAIALRPDYAEAHNNLGFALKAKGQFDEAIAACRQAIALRPYFADAHNNLGNALRDMGEIDEAILAYRAAVGLSPNSAEAHHNLGIASYDKGRLDEAISAYRQAVALKSDYWKAHNNLGMALQDKGQLDEAVAAYRRAIQLKPDATPIHWNLAVALLTMGRFAEGWEEFEWRLKDQSRGLGRDFGRPQWNGEDLTDKTLLVHAEGGYGDAFLFGRYVPMLRGRAKKIVLECGPAAVKLLGDLPGVDEIIARGRALPEFDCQIPLPSLPRLFKTDLTNIPNAAAYLKVRPEDQGRWKGRVENDGRLKVGLVWAGSPRPRKFGDDPRSRGLEVLAPLGQVPNVRFFSLQKGPESNVDGPRGLEMTDFTQELNDFSDTAALIENLDLVISVDTSVAHLAGALGKAVWVLVPCQSYFIWLSDRTDSPWYLTMRLFRQRRGENWASVVAEVVAALKEFVAQRSSPA